jgi:hypothetical protein
MSEPLAELYFHWLYKQVAYPEFEDQALTYWNVLRVLHNKEFIEVVPNDDNRIHDGRALRLKFLDDQGIPEVDPNWMELGCSFLELMVGLSERLAFEADGEPHYWFWVLMGNLELAGYNDKRRLPRSQIDKMLDRVIYRNYDYNGYGGLFPLRHPQYDQRERELWFQMSDYILEQELIT